MYFTQINFILDLFSEIKNIIKINTYTTDFFAFLLHSYQFYLPENQEHRLNVSVLCPKSFVEDLIPSLMVLGNGTFRICVGHEAGVLGNVIDVFMKKTPEGILICFACEDLIGNQCAIWKRVHSLHNCGKSIFVVYRLPSLWYFTIAPELRH